MASPSQDARNSIGNTMNLQLLNGIIAGIIAGNRSLYNPTYFYGPDDMVLETLYTVVSDYKETHPEDSVLWVSGDDFCVELINAIKENIADEFRRKYRSCDMLVMDRVEQLSGRQSAMIEFYEVFDHIFMQSGQIILGGRVPPVEIAGLDDRIRTQLESGMICRIG